uniref:WD_REPEATS_REGION domain-containing protein n=1 Tax=Globodera pallida TaxID=36090 RepID=A0A183BTR0_GLOPA
MNLARRAPALFNFKKNVLAVAGCSGPGKNWEENWKICEMKAPNAFSCAAFCQFADDTAFAFGGFDGRHCTRQSLLLRPSLPYPSSVHSLAPLPYGVKNGVAAVAGDCGERLLWLVGGWDGHRTLKTVFEYAFPEQNCSLKHILPYPIEGHSIAKSSVVAPQKAFIAGGFDGIGLRADFLAMDLRTGAVELIDGIALEKPRENHCSVIFGDGQGNEWLAIIGGWDGHKALADWEMFELLPDEPWLRPTDIGPWGEKPATLATARNRPATILI